MLINEDGTYMRSVTTSQGSVGGDRERWWSPIGPEQGVTFQRSSFTSLAPNAPTLMLSHSWSWPRWLDFYGQLLIDFDKWVITCQIINRVVHCHAMWRPGWEAWLVLFSLFFRWSRPLIYLTLPLRDWLISISAVSIRAPNLNVLFRIGHMHEA